MKIIVSVILFATLTLSDAENVAILSDSNFNSVLEAHDLVLVNFYSSQGCPECQTLETDFEQSAEVFQHNNPPVLLAKIDCVYDGKSVCGTHAVSAFPTLQVFRHGVKAFDYEGPRDHDGMVRHVISKLRPLSMELESLEDFDKFLSYPEYSIIGFFERKDSVIFERYEMFASTINENFRFAHTFNSEVHEKYSYKNTFLIFWPSWMHNKLELERIEYAGKYVPHVMRDWVTASIFGLVGHRTTDNAILFKTPLIVVYFEMDCVKNAKSASYWRNRVVKVAKSFADSGINMSFAVSNAADFAAELSEVGLSTNDAREKPVVVGRDANNRKFVMTTEFTVEELEKFAREMFAGSLKPVPKKQTTVPDKHSSLVKVIVGKTYDEIISNPAKDYLIQFCSLSFAECDSFALKYMELARKLRSEEHLVIAKMDVTTMNEIPKPFKVKRFPTIYFVPAHSSPMFYEGRLEVDDLIRFVSRESSTPLKSVSVETSNKASTVKTEL